MSDLFITLDGGAAENPTSCLLPNVGGGPPNPSFIPIPTKGGGGGGGVAAGAVVSSMGWEKLLLQSTTANDGEEKRCVCFAVFVYWWKRNEQREHFMHSKCLRLLTYLM